MHETLPSKICRYRRLDAAQGGDAAAGHVRRQRGGPSSGPVNRALHRKRDIGEMRCCNNDNRSDDDDEDSDDGGDEDSDDGDSSASGGEEGIAGENME